LRDVAVERKMCGDAATDSFGKRFAPSGFFRDKIQGGKHARLVGEKLAAELVWILPARVSDLVEKTFGREAGVGMADGAPPLNGNTNFRRVKIHLKIRNAVENVGGAFDG